MKDINYKELKKMGFEMIDTTNIDWVREFGKTLEALGFESIKFYGKKKRNVILNEINELIEEIRDSER